LELRHFGSLALPFTIALLLSAWAIAGFRARQGKTSGRSAILLAGIASPLLVTWVMLAAVPRFGNLRVALEGVRFRLEGLGQGQGFQVRVGGSPEQDHLVVRDLPPGFLTFQIDGSRVHAELAPDSSEVVDEDNENGAHKRFGVVRVNGERPFHNAVSMDEPARIVVNGTALEFDPKRPAFGAEANHFPAIPLRTTKIGDYKFRVYRELRAEQAIHPLRYYGSPDQDQELLGHDGEPLGSFIARDGKILRRQLYLVLTDESVRIERQGQPPIGIQHRAATIADGKAATFALYRVDYMKPWQDRAAQATAAQRGDEENEEPPPSRVQERRSFTARLDKGVLDLLFDTPSYVQLETAELDRLKRRAKRADVPALLRLVGHRFISTAGEGQMLLEFPVLGEPLSTELFSRIELPEHGKIRVTTHTGAHAYKLGDAFEIGDAAAAIIRITKLGVPWGTLLLLWAVAAVTFVTGHTWRERFIPLILLSGVELLLALRVLIAYEGAYIDPAAASAAWQSLGAFVAVPFILQATLTLYDAGWWSRDALSHAVVVVSALATILFRSHASIVDWIMTLAAVLGIPMLLGLTLRLPKIWPWKKDIPGFLPWLDKRKLSTPMDPARPFRPIWWAAAILVLIRLTTLLGLGWKERIDLGPVLAVSIFYTPMVLWIFARLWGRRNERRTFMVLWILLLVLYFLTSALARDLGSLLIFPIPVMVLFALMAAEQGWSKASLAVPLTTLVILFVFLPWLPSLGLSPRLTGWTEADVEKARSDKAAAEDLLASRTKATQNQLRSWNLVAPTELRQVGTQAAEGLVIVMANLRDYAGRGALGEGYLSVPLSEALRATHLDDNLSAVHVLAAFGWIGGLALLIFLCAWAITPVLALQSSSSGGLTSWITPRIAFGLMLVWTITVAGLYMFSANVELLLFTGKNVYFLAAASRSDLVEGTLLVLLALWALVFQDEGRTLS
jgi:hypothetical protein